MNEEEIFTKYLSERAKYKTLDEYPENYKNQMAVAVMAMGFSEHFAEETHTNSYNEILDLLKESREQNQILPKLSQIINRNFAKVISEYTKLKQQTFAEILGVKFQEYTFLIDQIEKKEVAERIKEACFSNKQNKNLVDKYDALERSLRMFDPQVVNLTIESLRIEINNDPDEILKGLASIIDDPSRLAYQREMLDCDYDKFPLKWYGLHMTIVDFRKYYRRFKNGENIDDYVEYYVDSRLEYIKKYFDNHYFSQFAKRANLLGSSIDAYCNKNYAATICTCLPLIESSIMKFAEYYHFYTGSLFTQIKDKKHLILKTGSHVKDFTIGDLLKNSELSTFFDSAFISYFCDDLYKERNPILHGEEVDGFSKLNAAKKILTFDYVVKVMEGFIFRQYQECMDKAMDNEIYEKLTTGIKLEDAELARFRKNVQELNKLRFT